MATYPIFGDTSGTLSGSARGGSQFIMGPDIPDGSQFSISGDAKLITDMARGGSDWIVGPKLPGGGGSFAYLDGDAETIAGSGRGGNDFIFCSDGPRNHASGDAELITDHGRGGNDMVFGANGPGNFSFVYGDATSMQQFARGGDDTVVGGANGGQNWLAGDAEGMSDDTHGGNDTVIGWGKMAGDGLYMGGHAQGGNDLLMNTAQGGSMYGEAERVFADTDVTGVVCGNDTLVSGTGSDDMWGDTGNRLPGLVTGADTFVFLRNSGQDAIEDFETGRDMIDLRAYAAEGVHGFAGLLVTATADATIIGLPDGSSVAVHGTVPVASDILFA